MAGSSAAGLRERIAVALWEAAREPSGEVYDRPDVLADALLPVVGSLLQEQAAGMVEAEAELGATGRARDSWYRKAQELRQRAETAEAHAGRLAAEVDRLKMLVAESEAPGDAVRKAAALGRVLAECDAIEREVYGQHDEDDDGMREAVRRVRAAADITVPETLPETVRAALDGTTMAPTSAVIYYQAGQTVHLYDWTLTVDHRMGTLELAGTVVPGSHIPITGAAVEVLRLDLPGRGQLGGIVAHIHTLPQSDGVRLVLTTTVEPPRD